MDIRSFCGCLQQRCDRRVLCLYQGVLPLQLLVANHFLYLAAETELIAGSMPGRSLTQDGRKAGEPTTQSYQMSSLQHTAGKLYSLFPKRRQQHCSDIFGSSCPTSWPFSLASPNIGHHTSAHQTNLHILLLASFGLALQRKLQPPYFIWHCITLDFGRIVQQRASDSHGSATGRNLQSGPNSTGCISLSCHMLTERCAVQDGTTASTSPDHPPLPPRHPQSRHPSSASTAPRASLARTRSATERGPAPELWS